MDINESVQWGNLHKKYLGNNNFDSGNAVGESVALLYKDAVSSYSGVSRDLELMITKLILKSTPNVFM